MGVDTQEIRNQAIDNGFHYAMTKRRQKIYIALEEVDFIWDVTEIQDIERMWWQGYSVWEIAKACGRPELEVVLLIMDREAKGRIPPRPNGLFRNEPMKRPEPNRPGRPRKIRQPIEEGQR